MTWWDIHDGDAAATLNRAPDALRCSMVTQLRVSPTLLPPPDGRRERQ
jgi:hypothetical protein